MRSLPADDLARGRRRLRHRRIGTAAGVAAVVPAVAVVAIVVPGNPWAGPDRTGFADDPDEQRSHTIECVGVEPYRDYEGEVLPGPLGAPPPAPDPDGDTQWFKAAARNAHDARGKLAAREDGRGSVVSVDGSCEEVPDGGMDTPEIDRLEQALTEGLDPDGEFLSVMSASSAGAASRADDKAGAAAEELSQASIAATWREDGGEGAVILTVIDPSADGAMTTGRGNDSACADPSLEGPELTCVRRRLDNGIIVVVGTGGQDGNQRITVRFERDDGEIVWATADQTVTSVWTDGSGTDPLDAPPATAEQLIDLVQDPRAHL